MHGSLALLASPLLLAQALYVRRRTPRLSEPPGPRSGSRGQGPALRLLITGDSSAAGVGAAHQDQALAGQLADRLATDFEVHWQLEARTGATTRSSLRWLERLTAARFDAVVTALGVNDVTAMTRLADWLDQQRALRQLLRERFQPALIIVSGLPPMHAFPALPQPLRAYLGSRATRFDRALAADLEDEPDCRFLGVRFTTDVAQMASDGFHPGPAVYAEWARRVAQVLRGAHEAQAGNAGKLP